MVDETPLNNLMKTYYKAKGVIRLHLLTEQENWARNLSQTTTSLKRVCNWASLHPIIRENTATVCNPGQFMFPMVMTPFTMALRRKVALSGGFGDKNHHSFLVVLQQWLSTKFQLLNSQYTSYHNPYLSYRLIIVSLARSQKFSGLRPRKEFKVSATVAPSSNRLQIRYCKITFDFIKCAYTMVLCDDTNWIHLAEVLTLVSRAVELRMS